MVRAARPGGRIILEDDDHAVLRLWPEPAGFSSLWQAYIEEYKKLGYDPYMGRRLVELLHQEGANLPAITGCFSAAAPGTRGAAIRTPGRTARNDRAGELSLMRFLTDSVQDLNSSLDLENVFKKIGEHREQEGGLRLGEGIGGTAASRRCPIRVADVREDPNYVRVRHTSVEIRSELAVPLTSMGPRQLLRPPHLVSRSRWQGRSPVRRPRPRSWEWRGRRNRY